MKDRVGKMIKWFRDHPWLTALSIVSWFRDHPWLTALSIVSVSSAIPLMVIEATRANTVVTIWSIFTLGLVVAIVLTEHGEKIQRRAWLRANSAAIGPFLAKLANTAGSAAMFTIGLSDETGRALQLADLRVRREASQLGHSLAITFLSDHTVQDPKKMMVNFRTWANNVQEWSTQIEAQVRNSSPEMSRLPELHAAIQRFNQEVRNVQWSASAEYYTGPTLEPLERIVRAYVAEAALGICDRCTDLFGEAPTLPR